MTWAIDAVRPLILQGWSEALPHVGMVIVVMVISMRSAFTAGRMHFAGRWDRKLV